MSYPHTRSKLANIETSIRLYCFIRCYIEEHNYPPTQRQMATGCYIASGTVVRHLDRLQMWGYIIREPGQPRTLYLTGIAPFRCDDCT